MSDTTINTSNHLREYEGDLLTAEVDVIAHQCNVMTQGAAGIAGIIFQQYPEVDTYKNNPQPLKFTTVEMMPVNKDRDTPYSFVANLYSQFFPASSQKSPSFDDAWTRLVAFKRCLTLLADEMSIRGLTSVGFPRYIGCAIAGGDWPTYHGVITKWADLHKSWLTVHIVGLPQR